MNKKQALNALWRKGKLHWKLHDSQKDVRERILDLPQSTREVLILISRRWGKSYLGVTMALMDCLNNDNVQVAIVGPSLKHTRNIILPIIRKITADAPKGLIDETKSELRWKVGNSTLIIAGFETALESLRGLELFNVYLEETGLVHPDNYDYTLRSVIFPTLMHSKSIPGAGRVHHLTTPAKEIDHPLHTQTLPKCDAKNALFIKDIYTNPLLTQEAIEEEIENSGGVESVHTQRELFCKIVRDASITVCPEYNDTFIHDFTLPKHPYTPLMAGDFGGVRDKHAFFLMWWDEQTDDIMVWDERIYDPQTSTLQIVEELKAWEASLNYPKSLVRWLDAPGQLRVDLANKPYHFPTNLPKKQGLDESVVELRRPFRQKKIKIHKRCTFLQKSLRSGRFNKNRTDFERTTEFGHLDAVAALIYGIRHVIMQKTYVRKRATQDTYYEPKDPSITGDRVSLVEFYR